MDLPGLLFLSALLAVKEAGLPIPVPGDLLVIGAGVAAARGGLPAPAVIAVLVGATVVGGIVQFALIRDRLEPGSCASSAASGSVPRRSTVERRACGAAGRQPLPSPG